MTRRACDYAWDFGPVPPACAAVHFWAPDGRSIGFFAPDALKRLDLGGGVPLTLTPVTMGLGGAWSADGVIVFADGRFGLFGVPVHTEYSVTAVCVAVTRRG